MDESALRNLLNSLEASRSSLHLLLHLFTCFVVVGLGFDLFVIFKEFRDDRADFRYGQIHPDENHLPKRPSKSLFIVAFLGTALIVIGVAGELYVDVRAGKIETQIREANDELLGLIIQEAGNAATSAKTAHLEADAVRKESDAIQERLSTASKQLNVIEGRIRAQGPRWLILANNAAEFIRDLKPFRGSRITVLICGGGVSPIEQLGTEERLLNLLGKPGSNWAAANWETGYENWRGCSNTSANGLEMAISGNASEGLEKAAKALRDRLLRLGIAASLHTVPADQEHFWAATGGADSLEARAARDPTTIFLLVAPNSMGEAAKPSTKMTKRHK